MDRSFTPRSIPPFAARTSIVVPLALGFQQGRLPDFSRSLSALENAGEGRTEKTLVSDTSIRRIDEGSASTLSSGRTRDSPRARSASEHAPPLPIRLAAITVIVLQRAT